jgi:putative effector of murein hydrolase LrgA (UPF0299 family)
VLGYLTLLLCCQLAGEVLVLATDLPLPGPVLGMVLLFVGLIVRGHVPAGLQTVAQTLLQHLSLLFVPAGVGVMLHLKLIGAEWPAISGALIVSAVLTIAVTAGLMALLSRRGEAADGGDGGNSGPES